MEEQGQVLKYISGRGWLVFSGGNDAVSEVRAQALARAGGYGTSVVISLADDGGDSLKDDLEDLGARAGYFVDLQFDSPDEIEEQMKMASFIAVETGSSLDALYGALRGAGLEALKQAYERGAVILLEGLTINLFGRWVVSDGGELLEGFNWVQNAFIEPESMGIDDSRAVQAVLNEIADAVAINVARGSALVLGADGQVELWGEKQVTVSLGSNYAS